MIAVPFPCSAKASGERFARLTPSRYGVGQTALPSCPSPPSHASGRRVGGVLGAAPGDRVLQSLLERHDGYVAEEGLRLGDVRLRVVDVAGARFLVDRRDGRADDR